MCLEELPYARWGFNTLVPGITSRIPYIYIYSFYKKYESVFKKYNISPEDGIVIFVFGKNKKNNINLEDLNIKINGSSIKISHNKKHLLFLYVINQYWSLVSDDTPRLRLPSGDIDNLEFNSSLVETILKDEINTVVLETKGETCASNLDIIFDNQKKLDKIFF